VGQVAGEQRGVPQIPVEKSVGNTALAQLLEGSSRFPKVWLGPITSAAEAYSFGKGSLRTLGQLLIRYLGGMFLSLEGMSQQAY
jgi:hypothetical protein